MSGKTNYVGIDYGMGRTNIDDKGIRYGVIPQHAVMSEALSDFDADYGDPACPECGGKVVDYDDETHGEYKEPKHGCCDWACESCELAFDSESVYGESPIAFTYERDGYKLAFDADGDVWVFKSPYYTHAQFCSPCAPGAGYLKSPCDEGPKTYCLGADWFDEYRPRPYEKIFHVSDDKPVEFEPEYVRPKCDQCEILCINGVACHETGCPVQAEAKRQQELDDYGIDEDGDDFFDSSNLGNPNDE